MDEEGYNADIHYKGHQFNAQNEEAVLTLNSDLESTAEENGNLNNVLSSDALISDAH